jgi:septal ring factor EnvC (AmiA/AmiB activator)|tara:strand:+ start:5916 stop:6149 length:234 start_codon:yes stop_codon:yes gene_type:complete
MKNHIPVEGKDGYFRDTHSGAIVNKNNLEFQAYVKNRDNLNKEKKKFEKLQSEVTDLKTDMNEIKSMLNSITDLLNK